MENQKRLFLVHCGFYDPGLGEGIYESHVNLLVAAQSFEDARVQVKLLPEFQRHKMHVDGLVQIDAVQGFRVRMEADPALGGNTHMVSSRHRDLAPAAIQRSPE